VGGDVAASVGHVQTTCPPTAFTAGVVQLPPPVTGPREMNAAFDGIVSVATTFSAVDGPLLRAVTTNSSGAPACTGFGVAVFSAWMSTTAVTALVTPAALLPRLGSPTSSEVIVAVLVRLPVVARLGRTTTVIVAVPPFASVPRLQLRLTVAPLVTPDGVQAPCDGVADWKPPVAMRLVSGSVTTTLVAGSGP
jgi:hypothetical protein